jgi:hypothetical protein
VSRPRSPRPLPLGAQTGALRHHWPQGTTTLSKNTVRWVGPLQPTPLSPTYTVSVEYRFTNSPQVYVLDPKLDPGHRERLPHVYTGDRLCLYTPGTGEWNRSMNLAQTIIPWAAEWLLHYEIWQVTDKWHGSGHVYAPADEDPRVDS